MALTQPKSLLSENDVGLVDHIHHSESGEDEKKSLESDIPLDEMANECSKLIKHALDERSQTAGTISELQATLSVKDQEIEDLNARVSELSLSNDIFLKIGPIRKNRMKASLSNNETRCLASS